VTDKTCILVGARCVETCQAFNNKTNGCKIVEGIESIKDIRDDICSKRSTILFPESAEPPEIRQ